MWHTFSCALGHLYILLCEVSVQVLHLLLFNEVIHHSVIEL